MLTRKRDRVHFAFAYQFTLKLSTDIKMDKSNPSDVLQRRRKSAASLAHQLDLDGSSDFEVQQDFRDNLLASARKTSSIKGSLTKLHDGSSSPGVESSTSLTGSTSSHRPSPHPANTKGLILCLATTDPSLIAGSDLSDLTSLSSSTRSSSPSMASPVDSDAPKPPLCTPPKVVPLPAGLNKYGQLSELNEPTWSANDLDSYVWVLLDPKSNRVYDPDRDENECKDRLWWPAKVCTFRLERDNVYPNCHRSRAQEILMSLLKSLYLDPDLKRWKSKPHLWKTFCPSWT